MSTDAGGHWALFRSNLPTTLYDDLVIHPRDNDLVVATHGRSIWILDDVTPLVEWSPQIAARDLHLFTVRPVTVFQYWKDTSYRGQAAYAGTNPPYGAILTYYLKSRARSAHLTVTNRRGETVRVLAGPTAAGIHRAVWDLRHEPPPFEAPDDRPGALPELPHPVTPQGPIVSPGVYTVTLQADDQRTTQTVTLEGDPLMTLNASDWEARERFTVALLDLQRRAWEAEQLVGALHEARCGEVPPDIAPAADSAEALEHRVCRLREQIYGLAEQFNGNGVRQGSLYPPTETQRRRKHELEVALDEALADLTREREREER